MPGVIVIGRDPEYLTLKSPARDPELEMRISFDTTLELLTTLPKFTSFSTSKKHCGLYLQKVELTQKRYRRVENDK